MSSKPDAPVITAEELRHRLDYWPETGQFTWREVPKWHPQRLGQIAGSQDTKGRWTIHINHRNYFAHRLAWLHVHGRWPAIDIDHVNRDHSDNRLVNLREATRTQNQANRIISGKTGKNKFGLRGVRISTSGKYYAVMREMGRSSYLGSFDTPEEAGAAYRSAFKKLHGEFALLD